ncbi:MAG: hypothetical protein IPK58_25105 [Acidobacteria bacterium]|nr:hypothetical protein [Acidobacteriota bacterium]
MTRHQFLLLRNKLKLGLTLEKIRAFDSAFSIYKTLILDTIEFFKDKDELNDHRTIQLVSMPFVAQLAITEKARNDGVTYTNLRENRKQFKDAIKASDKDSDRYRKNFPPSGLLQQCWQYSLLQKLSV